MEAMEDLTMVGLGLDYGTIRLERTRECWVRSGAALRDGTSELLGALAVGVEQMGSSSVRGLLAKPIIDLAVGVESVENLDSVRQALEAAGWIYRGDAGDEGGHVFVLEARPWHRVAHLHVVQYGSPQWVGYLRFRDLLRAPLRHAADTKPRSYGWQLSTPTIIGPTRAGSLRWSRI